MKKFCFIILLSCLYISTHAAIKVGTPNYDPPFVLDDPANGVSGFDIDYMKKICDHLKWECTFVPMKYSKLSAALQDNQIDFAVGALIISPDKQQDFLFSIPYLISEAGFLVKIDSPITKVSDLEGKSVGAMDGKAYITYLQEHFGNKMTVVPYNFFNLIALDLQNEKINAIFMNYMSALYIQHQYPDKITILNEHFPVGEGIGIMTLPANKDKIDQINKVILQFQGDGTFADLYNYNFEFFIRQPKK